MITPCGCYRDAKGKVFARCPFHSGNTNDTEATYKRLHSERSKRDRQRRLGIVPDGHRTTFLRDSLQDGKVRIKGAREE